MPSSTTKQMFADVIVEDGSCELWPSQAFFAEQV